MAPPVASQPDTVHTPAPPSDRNSDDWVGWLLDTARRRLGLDVAWLSAFTEDEQVLLSVAGDLDRVPLEPGLRAPLEGSYCVRVVGGHLPPVVTGSRRDPRTRDLDVTTVFGIGSYVGAPVRAADGRPIGMLCCAGRDDGAHLDAGAARSLQLLADLVSEHVRRSPLATGPDPAAGRERVLRLLRGGELVTELQPVVDMATGEVVGAEALTRFPNAGDGGPARVFSDAAAAGLGPDLERLAVQRALAVAGSARPGRLWMNVSPGALVAGDLVDLLLAHRGGRIGVELTEHAPVDDYPALLAATGRLREGGVLLSVDDAGAGYASLAHVLRLRPDVVKLDIGLVAGLDADPAKRAMVSAMAAFADETGTELVAEGVERPAERDVLLERGVRWGQGYLLGRPAPVRAG